MPISSQKLPAQVLAGIKDEDRRNGAKRTHKFFCLVLDHVTRITEDDIEGFYVVLDEKGITHIIWDGNVRMLIDGEHENMVRAIESGIEPSKVGAELLEQANL